MRRCYYITTATPGKERPTKGIAHPGRVYRSERDAAAAAKTASEQKGSAFDVGTLDSIPEWALEVETADHEIMPPSAVAEDGAPIYAMRYRPATQFGTLPPGVEIEHWTRVPEELRAAFPDHPVSKRRFGEFVANRPLTAKELDRFQIDEIG